MSAVPDRTAPFFVGAFAALRGGFKSYQHQTSTIGMSSPPPAKRPRSDSESAPRESQYSRDDEFWFTDGSIILVAGNTTFRVYHGILATNSVVFHDMVQFPQPLTTPSLDGCPILEISDSPADLKHLLRVLFPKPAVRATQATDAPVTMEYISALIRLSHKYQMEGILKDALSYLTDYYSSDYNEWLKRDQKPLKVKPIHAMEAVTLARLTETYTILPSALLACAVNVGENILDGYTREDGSLVTLSTDDLKRCFFGYRRLKDQEALSVRELAEVVGESGGCLQPMRCRKVMLEFWDSVHGRFGENRSDFLRPWAELLGRFRSSEWVGICAQCSRNVQREPKFVRGRHGIWNDLPRTFSVDVPQWPVRVDAA